MIKKQPTLADLAKELGISTATVSRALKDYPDISSATKKKVLELAEKWNYHPNSIAAGLRKQESRVIGVIIPEIVNHFFSTVIKGIMEIAYEAGYKVMLCQSNESYEKEVADSEALLNSRVDGVLVSVAHETSDYRHFHNFQRAGIPIIFFDKVIEDMDHTTKIVVDDKDGAYRAVSHLIQQGRRRIAMICGPSLAYTARERFQGYQLALKEHNIPLVPELVIDGGRLTHEEAVEIGKKLYDMRDEVDGLFAVTDIVAIGAMVGMKARGLKIPEDIAIIGFSDWLMATVVEPQISSVYQPGYEMGRLATELMLKEIRAQKEEKNVHHQKWVLPVELKLRSSSLAASNELPG